MEKSANRSSDFSLRCTSFEMTGSFCNFYTTLMLLHAFYLVLHSQLLVCSIEVKGFTVKNKT